MCVCVRPAGTDRTAKERPGKAEETGRGAAGRTATARETPAGEYSRNLSYHYHTHMHMLYSFLLSDHIALNYTMFMYAASYHTILSHLITWAPGLGRPVVTWPGEEEQSSALQLALCICSMVLLLRSFC